eukprot:CAMPEP_0183759860 /NCGR_PEP_ID=MMETSP0739-20130205/7358_1 /TAXON_ID=385413 /ORGANISM="Thalassiosira miniscula, Strain CCMP1093" /LENGTH=159 /DNA_ID=CAMNT_0025997707 /DNA_START=1 /DNA_END=480 /DNA_ORIENTATION=-
MASKSPERPQQILRKYPTFLVSILVAVFFNTGNAFIPLPLHVASAMSTDTSGSTSKPLSASVEGSGESSEPLQLPEASGDPSIPTIKLGESIRFEEMGPIIINADGSTRRIDNWDQMTKNEQEVAWRRISKRNEQRRKALLEQQQKEMEVKEEEEEKQS